MKFEKINETDYKIYLFNFCFNDNAEEIKKILRKLQKSLNLCGFYKVYVCNASVGLFLRLRKLDDSFYKDTLDFKIVFLDCEIYFKTKDYFIVSDCLSVYYYDNYYYALVDNSFSDIVNKIEFGRFVYGEEILFNDAFKI